MMWCSVQPQPLICAKVKHCPVSLALGRVTSQVFSIETYMKTCPNPTVSPPTKNHLNSQIMTLVAKA